MSKKVILSVVLFTFVISCITSLVYAQSDQQFQLDSLTSKVVWGADGQHIVIGTLKNGIIVYDVTLQEQIVHIPYSETGPVGDFALSPDGRRILSRDINQDIRIWNASTGETLQNVQTDANILSVAWSPDGQFFASSGLNGTQVWNAYTLEMIFYVPEMTEDTPKLAFSQDNKLVISWATLLDIWDTSTRQRTKRVRLSGLRASVEWSKNNQYILMPSTFNLQEGTSHRLRIWDVNNEQIIQEFSGFPTYITSARWSPDETEILSTDLQGDVYLTDIATGTTTILMSSNQRIFSAAWSYYSGRIVVGVAVPTSSEVEDAVFINSQYPAEIKIIVPTPSLERLAAIAELCVQDSATRSAEVNNLTRQAPAALDDLPAFVAQVEALSDDAIPPACKADLLAVASVLGE